MSTHPGALSDLRVVEMGVLLAGPYAGQLFADHGAEVIKLEPPGQGDPMRDWGQEKPHGQSLWWPVVARNKKSVTVNLRTAEGQDLVRRLAAVSDVLIANLRPGTLETLLFFTNHRVVGVENLSAGDLARLAAGG